jgi:hypothetical protein
MSDSFENPSDPLPDPSALLFLSTRKPRFALGQVVATPGALRLLQQTGTDAMALLMRHVTGDWGDICAEDAKENELSIAEGFRVMSVYALTLGDQAASDGDERERVWLITEADRSVTTLLLPRDY